MDANAYVQLRAAFMVEDRRIDEIARLLSQAGDELKRNRQYFEFTVSQPDPGERPSIFPKAKIPMTEWKSIDEITAHLAAWRDARDRMKQAWNDLDPSSREGVARLPPGI